MNKKDYLEKIDKVIANGKFKDTWESLSQYEPPTWYKNAKFGIFIHWGVYSVPAFGSEWYPKYMNEPESKVYQHHIKNYGKHEDFGYEDFIPMFKAEKFNADEWSTLFKESGAQYVVPVAEHHDGFQMYKSELSHWNAYEMGPNKDIIGEISGAVNENDMMFGASSHRIEHWFFMDGIRKFMDITEDDLAWPAMPEPKDHFDLFDESVPTKEYMEDWLVRCCEIVDNYKPKIMYFDWWIIHNAVAPYLRKFTAYYYNRAVEWGIGVVINYKHDAFAFGTAVPDIERGQFADIKPYIWQSDTAVARNSWCYTEGNNYKQVSEILCDLIDIVSKNGRMLLNIGPRADGIIPDEDKHILLEIGKWLKINGEAVYGSKTWRIFGEGPTKITEGQFTDGETKIFTSEDIRFTSNNGAIYVFVLNASDCDEITVKSLAEKHHKENPIFMGIIDEVTLLGSDEKVVYSRDEDGLNIKLKKVNDNLPIVFKVTIK